MTMVGLVAACGGVVVTVILAGCIEYVPGPTVTVTQTVGPDGVPLVSPIDAGCSVFQISSGAGAVDGAAEITHLDVIWGPHNADGDVANELRFTVTALDDADRYHRVSGIMNLSLEQKVEYSQPYRLIAKLSRLVNLTDFSAGSYPEYMAAFDDGSCLRESYYYRLTASLTTTFTGKTFSAVWENSYR